MMRDDPKTESELLRYLNALRSRAAQPEQAELEKQTAGPDESEQIFRAIFDNAADGILLVDVDNKKFYMANKAFRQMLGYNEHQFKDLGIADIHPAEDLPYVTEQFEKQAREEPALAKDIPVRRRDGSVFFADVNSFPITLGQKTYLMGIFRDITERKEAVEEICKLAKFPDENPNPTLRISEDCTLLYANRASSPVLETWGIQVGQSLPAACCKRAKEALSSGKVSTFEFNCDDGRIFLVTLVPVVEQGYLNAYALDITERKQAEETLRQHESWLKYLVSSSPAVIYTCKPSGDYGATYISENVAPQMGYEAKDFIENTSFWLDHIHQDDRQRILDGLSILFEKGRYSHEYRFLHGDGSYRWMHDEMKLVRDEQGNPREIIGSWMDITERKQAEVELKESEQRFSTIFDNAADGILLADLETKKFYMGNRAICKMLGCNQDELKELAVTDIHPEEDLPYIVQVFAKQAKGQLKLAKDTPVKRRDGSVFFADINAFPITLGEKRCLAGIFRDVTERKNAEQALRESEDQSRIIFEGAAEGILLLEAEDGKIIDFNEAACEQLGYTREEFQKLTIADVEVIESAEDVAEHMGKVSRNRGDAFETKHRTKDGSIRERFVSCGVASIRGQERVVSIWNDVTEIRQAEEALRQSEQKWRSLAENAPDVIMTVDPDGTILFINHPIDPLTQEQVVGTSAYDYIPSEHQNTMRSAIEQVVRTGEPCGYELAGTGPGGRISWYRSRIGPINRDDQVIALTLIARDVTEHKQMEEALQQSEELYRSVVEDSPGMLCSFLPDGAITFVNAAYCEYFGKRSEELLGSKFTTLIPEENGQTILDNILSLTVDSPSMTHEHRVMAPDGQIRWQRWINRAFFDEQGRAVRFQAFGEDITNRKKAEEALWESELRYRTLFETLPVGVGLAALEGRVIDANSTMQQMTGRSLEELSQVNVQDTYRNPDERMRLLKLLQQDGIVRDFEAELLRKDGTTYIASLDVTPFRLRDETVLVTVARDITAHKRTQEQLAQSEETLRSLVNSITESVMLIDTEGTVLAINESCAGRLGGSVDELMGKCTYDFVAANVEELRRSKVEQVIRTGRPVRFEDRPPGRVVRSSLYPVLDGLGNVEGVAVFGLDITEQERMQQALAESEEKYKTLVESAGDAIATIDRDGVFLFVNRTAATRFGCEPEELAGKTLWEVFPKESADEHAAAVRKVIDTAKGSNMVKLVAVPGSPRWFNTALEPLRDSSGKVTAAMLIARDVHDMRQAEEQIRTLSSAVEQSIDGISIGDLEHKLQYVNTAYARMHGYTAEEMKGINIRDLQNKAQTFGYDFVVHQVETQGAWTGEREHSKKDGTVFPCYISVTLLKNDRGQATGRLAVCRDMTEYKKTQQMMMIKDAAIASSINAIVIGSPEGNLAYVNDSFLKMWGYENQNEVLGRNAAEFWEVNDEAEAIVEALQRGKGWIGELAARRKDGSPFDAQVCQTSIRDENDSLIALMASFVDITESKRSREQLSLYRERMAHAEQLASLGSLSATVAHELTQPLTVIRLSLESALEKTERRSAPETVTKKLKASLNQVSNIVALTDRFRNFARKSSERTFLDVDLKALTERIMRLLGENSQRAGIAVRLDENMGELPPLHCHEKDMEQLFFALIDNAIRATEGRNNRQLTIGGLVKDGHVELRFSDDCGGIAPENLDRVFEPFFTTRPPGQGTGLGLCIVQEIVSRARGKVHIESKFGEGTTFIVTLPLGEGDVY